MCWTTDPFFSLDQTGVGRLVRMATEEGREANPELKVGICGEHGGEAESIDFFHEIGLDYVSCSSFRVPVARLAAAQAALRKEGGRDSDQKGSGTGSGNFGGSFPSEGSSLQLVGGPDSSLISEVSMVSRRLRLPLSSGSS